MNQTAQQLQQLYYIATIATHQQVPTVTQYLYNFCIVSEMPIFSLIISKLNNFMHNQTMIITLSVTILQYHRHILHRFIERYYRLIDKYRSDFSSPFV